MARSGSFGYYLVSIPFDIRTFWIEGKDDEILGNLYRPNHEVGNLLSYPSYESSESIDVDSTIVVFPEQTVGATGGGGVELIRTTFSENAAAKSWEAGGSFEQSIGEAAEFYGLEAGFHLNLSGEYNRGEIITTTVSVGESMQIIGDFGSIKSDIGGSATYYIEPYAYWSDTGALVLDYKVDIPEGSNFWSEHYSGPDLAFSLPWRYDTDKGFPLPGDQTEYLQRTRDIVLSEPNPEAGEEVRIAARVRNMGLQDITSPIDIEFYEGDPESGGSLIERVTTDEDIEARSTQNVMVDWEIPEDADLTNTKIYVVIDPDNTISEEIHENNNTGWIPARHGSMTTSDEPLANTQPKRVKLYPAYPNPFNPTTTIGYELPKNSHVRLDVFNILGQRVSTLVNDRQSIGFQEVTFDASNLSSGVYLYRLTTEETVQSQKIILLK